MKLFALAVSAVVGLAAAQLEMLSEVPQCALECFTGTIMKTDCALTDFYCQCGKNSEFIQKTTLECLCTSECTTSDLAKVYSISNQLCTKTLADHGETYNSPADTLATGICHSSDAPTEASSTASAVSAATTGSSSSSSNSTGSSANGTTSMSPKASGADFEGAAASGFGMSLAAVAIGAFAFMI
ncbi:hypothetical protein Q7P35_009420 [Cladosporium inversicolor]